LRAAGEQAIAAITKIMHAQQRGLALPRVIGDVTTVRRADRDRSVSAEERCEQRMSQTLVEPTGHVYLVSLDE
jgi:hypothetical protein